MDSSPNKKNGRSEKGSFTKTTACPGAPRDEKNRENKKTKNKLIPAPKTRRKSNMS